MAGRVVWVWVLIAVLSLIPSGRVLPENYALLATCFAGCTANYGSLFYFTFCFVLVFEGTCVNFDGVLCSKGRRDRNRVPITVKLSEKKKMF